MSSNGKHRIAVAGFGTLFAGKLMLLTGCAFVATYNPGGNLGTTAGGVQDVASARAIILSGGIPDPDSITVEGLLSEHDIPITPPDEIDGEFFPSFAVTWRKPFGEVAPMSEVMVAIGTTIDLDTFQRERQNLVLVVDRSGSMAELASPDDRETKLQAVQRALRSLLDQLTSDDLVSIVTFSDRNRVVLPATSGDDREAIEQVINGLRSDGGTNIEDALRTGFGQAAAAADPSRANRVILFTDALPNIGATESDDFLGQLEGGASLGIGFTLMGVGLNFGNDLAYDISQVRNGNSFFLSDAERIATVFEEDFDFLVTPAAYDVIIDTVIPDGIGIRDVYGVPDYVAGSAGARVHIPTLFLSRREGGGTIIVRLTFAQSPTFESDVTVAEMSMTYTTLGGAEQLTQRSITLPAGLSPEGQPPYYSDAGAQRAAILLDTTLALRDAADAARDRFEDGAIDMLEAFLSYFDQSVLGLSDRTEASSRGLSEERDLVENLLGTIQSCGRYGCSYYYSYD